MNERFADVSAEQRHARNAQRARQEAEHQERLSSAEAADIVETQLVQIHVHDAGAQEQR